MSANMTTFAAVFKNLYPQGPAEFLAEECPLWGWLPKAKDFYGDVWVLSPNIGGGMGSTKFSVAAAYKRTPIIKKFQITRVSNYEIISVNAEAMLASSNNKGAFARVLDTNSRQAIANYNKAIGMQCYSNSGGSKGKGNGAYSVAGSVITLNQRLDAVNFEHEEVLEFASTDGTSGSARVGYVSVAKVSVEAGTITVNETINAAIVGAVNTDYIFRAGDFGNCITGLRGWLPSIAPTAGDNFFSVDRSIAPEKLGGIRYAGGGAAPDETLINALGELALFGGKPDAIFVHPLKFTEIEMALHAKVFVDVASTVPGIGYKAIQLRGPKGNVALIADQYCPYADFFMLQRNTWTFKSLTESPHFAMDDGKKMSRENNSDGVELRVRGFHNLGCELPGKNLHGTW